IAEVARTVAEVVGFRGRIAFDTTKPDGAPLKALDSSVLVAMGWRPATDFRSAVAETYHWFLRHRATEGTDEAEYTSPTVPVAVPHPPGRRGGRPGVPVRQD